MSTYTKDDINFHGFLAAVRKKQRKSLRIVAKGVYSLAMLNRIETGERLPNKLERDRIVARLGVSQDGYEDYLSREEYKEWVLRQSILKNIQKKNLSELEEQLERFTVGTERSGVELQFLEAMRFMLLKLQGAPEEELRRVIELAVTYTIPDIEEGLDKELLLADQEINLLIEYVSLHIYGNTEEELHLWRRSRYQDIITYIEQSCIDNIGRSKVFPKLVYYICLEYMDGKETSKELEGCLKLCNEAIELLRDTTRMFYLVELLELRQTLIAGVLAASDELPVERVEELNTMAQEAREWEQMLKELYGQYEVSAYMEDFCYLYWETESHSINRVITDRRSMQGESQTAFAKTVCSEKTVRRIEKWEISPQIYDVRGLFGKSGLCPEYVRANVITIEPEVMELHIQMNRYIVTRDFEKWEEALDKLENSLCLDIIQNKQIVMRERNLLALCRDKKSTEEYIANTKEILKYTIPLERMEKWKEWYMTVSEISCMEAFAVRIGNMKKNPHMKLLIEYCMEEIEKDQIENRIAVDDLLFTDVANYLGSNGEYEKSNLLSETIIKIDLQNRRMTTLAKNLYNKLWNDGRVQNVDSSARDRKYANKVLTQCILLCTLTKSKKLKLFFESKLQD